MKHLELENIEFIEQVESFTSWLKALGYAESTVTSSPTYITEFFYYLEANTIKTITEINNPIVKEYFVYLSRRKNQTKGGGLSINCLRNHFNALRRFAKYYRDTRQGNIDISVILPTKSPEIKTILSKKEIKELYEVTGNTPLGLRDKAMLSIYYGCGLRRSEGLQLDITDVHLNMGKIHVRRGKGNKARVVPITEAIKTDIGMYLKNARPVLIAPNPAEKAFFVGITGNRLGRSMMFERLQKLKRDAGIFKEVGLHTLRHSIATHLLNDGVNIELVSQFLGHSSLESTQVYTHVSAETIY